MTETKTVTEAMVRAVFDHVLEPKLQWTINSLNLVQSIEFRDSGIFITVNLVTEDEEASETFRNQVIEIIKALGAPNVVVLTQRVNVATEGVSGIEHIILVGSGKGGVGKSNIAVNIAAALQKAGHRVGLMDADIYGPSVPIMLGTQERPEVLPDEYLMPVEAHGLKVMSIGFLVDEKKALDWRGSLVSGTIVQFIQKTFWGELDYLVIDLPPGTGDIQLTIAHKIKSDGVILVTTPQEVVLGDVRRAADLFQARKVPILGIVENMSSFTCEHCGQENDPFPASKRELEADPLEAISILAKIPLSRKIAEAADSGLPIALDAESSAAAIFAELAEKISAALSVEANSTASPKKNEASQSTLQ